MQMTVGELEQALFEAFPRTDALDWDRPGMSVGDRTDTVGKVAFNLDPTAEAVLAAAEAGCNVLVTHHPVLFKDNAIEFSPQEQAAANGVGRMIFEAARCGVSVISMHTNADRAVAVRQHFAELLGMEDKGNYEHLEDPSFDESGKGFGVILETPGDSYLCLENLGRKCREVFGGAPRIWGRPGKVTNRIAYLNGSWSEPEVYHICTANDIDAIVVGEHGYHFCVDDQPHLGVIELGHDRSELPIVDVLMDTVAGAGIPAGDLVKLDCSENNWWTI